MISDPKCVLVAASLVSATAPESAICRTPSLDEPCPRTRRRRCGSECRQPPVGAAFVSCGRQHGGDTAYTDGGTIGRHRSVGVMRAGR
jgi:hypothetical protein